MLKPKQRIAALCLRSGGSQREAGEAAGVTARTIRQWLSDFSDFKELAQPPSTPDDVDLPTSPRAVLERLMQSHDPTLRLRAAVEITKLDGTNAPAANAAPTYFLGHGVVVCESGRPCECDACVLRRTEQRAAEDEHDRRAFELNLTPIAYDWYLALQRGDDIPRLVDITGTIEASDEEHAARVTELRTRFEHLKPHAREDT